MKKNEEKTNLEKKFIRSFAMSKDCYNKLDDIARDSNRSRSNMIEFLINNYYESLKINQINSIL